MDREILIALLCVGDEIVLRSSDDMRMGIVSKITDKHVVFADATFTSWGRDQFQFYTRITDLEVASMNGNPILCTYNYRWVP